MNTQTLKAKINIKIDRSVRQVFLRSDFEKLGGYDQIGRALRQLATEGNLIKIGYGLYAKARLNRLTGKPMLAAEGGFATVAKEALKRLGVKWTDTNFDAYQKGATLIPVNAQVVVFGRFNRKMESIRIKQNNEALYRAAGLLKDLNEQVVYVGGRIVGLLITDIVENDVRLSQVAK